MYPCDSPRCGTEILAVANGNPVYIFWSGKGDEESATKNWAKYLARLSMMQRSQAEPCGRTGCAIRSLWTY